MEHEALYLLETWQCRD